MSYARGYQTEQINYVRDEDIVNDVDENDIVSEPVEEEGSYTRDPREQTVATNPSARKRKAIRAKMVEHLKTASVSLDRDAISKLTTTQLYEVLGIDPVMMDSHDPDHKDNSVVLDRAVEAELSLL